MNLRQKAKYYKQRCKKLEQIPVSSEVRTYKVVKIVPKYIPWEYIRKDISHDMMSEIINNLKINTRLVDDNLLIEATIKIVDLNH